MNNIDDRLGLETCIFSDAHGKIYVQAVGALRKTVHYEMHKSKLSWKPIVLYRAVWEHMNGKN